MRWSIAFPQQAEYNRCSVAHGRGIPLGMSLTTARAGDGLELSLEHLPAPEETARRDLFEETGVEARDLHFAGRYYPSPGAYSEFLYSYVATADLSGRDKGVSGLDDEAEDIMAHVIPFDEAMAMIETGAANTGPLIISLRWIAMHRHEMAGDDF